MRRRQWLLTTGAIMPVLGGCAYSSEYPLSWDEEVLLHDGRMIVVRVTRHFTRTVSLPTFQTQYILRDMAIEFDAGPPWGRYRRRFVGYQSIEMLDFEDGNWYLVILGDPGKHRITDPRYPFWIVGGDGTERAVQSKAEFPDFPLLNVLPHVGSQGEFFAFENKLLRWDTKIRFWRDHPRAPGDTPEQIRNNQSLGARK